MANIYIPFSTGEGQTAKIAHYIADVMRARGHHAQTADIKQSDGPIPAGYDGVIVGASIHMGKHDKHAVDYVRTEPHRARGAAVRPLLGEPLRPRGHR